MQNNTFKKIKGYSNYSVSTTGLVRNDNTGHILALCKISSGYYSVKIKNDEGVFVHNLIHRLVALTHIDTDLHTVDLVVNHIDGDKINNNVNNLEWCTVQQNFNHAHDILNVGHKRRAIIRIDDHSNKVTIYPSINHAVKAGYNRGHIWACANKQRKTHKGFRWEYV